MVVCNRPFAAQRDFSCSSSISELVRVARLAWVELDAYCIPTQDLDPMGPHKAAMRSLDEVSTYHSKNTCGKDCMKPAADGMK